MRRFQLMEPERGGFRSRLARATSRLRDGLLRDNKVVPAVLGALALIVFAWIIAGALIGDPRGGGGGRQVANQANQPSQQPVQEPEEGQDGPAETPAPSLETRDTESYAAYEQKDPFRDLFEAPGADGDGTTGDDGAGDDQYGDDGTGDGGGDEGTGDGGGGGDFIDQTSPGDPGFGDDGGGGGEGGGGGRGGGGGSSGGGSGGGNDDLFDSGGNLAP